MIESYPKMPVMLVVAAEVATPQLRRLTQGGYPSKPVTLLIPYDERFGQAVVVANRVGANRRQCRRGSTEVCSGAKLGDSLGLPVAWAVN